MTLLTIDVGSSSVRALLFDNTGDVPTLISEAIVQRRYSFDQHQPGQATVEPLSLRGLVEQCVDEVLQHPAATPIDAVGMDTFVSNWLATDGQHEALTPLFTYADTRSAPHIPALRRRVDADEMHQRTGCILHTAYYPAQFSLVDYPHSAEPFILHHEDFATWCYRHWFGRDVPMSYSVASWGGLLHRESLRWDDQWLQALHLPETLLPALADYDSAQHGLTDDYARRWPALRDVPFFLAVGDGAAAQIGSGAAAEHTLALTVGTTAALRTVSTAALPPVPDGLWSYRIGAGQHLIGGALSEGGNVFQWARNTLQIDPSDLQASLGERAPGAHGLTVLPLLSGERSPGWHPNATGTIHGLRVSTTPLDVFHALVESVALRLSMVAGQLGAGDARIMASGGALHASPAWAQIIADAMGQPLHLLDEPEVTALGVAQLVHSALKGEPLRGAEPHVKAVLQPRTEHQSRWRALREEQQALYERVYG